MTATSTFKCCVIGADGQVDPNSYKFLTWSYYVEWNRCSLDKSLAQRVRDAYPHLADEATKIVHVDEDNNKIAIPCDTDTGLAIQETLTVLKSINNNVNLEEQRSPIKIFIQLVSPSAPATGNCLCTVNHDLRCSICKKELKNKHVYKCLQCDNDSTLCELCDNKHAVKHPEHVIIRFVGGQKPNCLPEMKQLLSVQQRKPEVD
ncbi:uncharacterized protein LOC124198158 [Daphnia pulex]|uniref:uncharacterized protein LOC124198158 n=1 Tax=Daphnia pulex TaxID=6669 RepID=UPI001EE0C840|nr:uncharacterized protein LOC124198158 [Daphnia pulex]